MIKDACILYINLTDKSIEIQNLDAEIYCRHPGGSALARYIMENGENCDAKALSPQPQHVSVKPEPFSPENLLIFSVSPLTGIPISGNSRMTITTRSPISGSIESSQAGGFIPVALKGNGYDAIAVLGKSETPVYIYIDGTHVEIRDAGEAWGKTVSSAEEWIFEDLKDKNVESSIIGPAGENLVEYAAIIHMGDKACGKHGTGAVMGSKMLKALVVKKAPPLEPKDKDVLKKLAAKAGTKENGVCFGCCFMCKNAVGRKENDPLIEYCNEYGLDAISYKATLEKSDEKSNGRAEIHKRLEKPASNTDQDRFNKVLDMLCLCRFPWGFEGKTYGQQDLAALCKYGLDWDITPEELMCIIKRQL